MSKDNFCVGAPSGHWGPISGLGGPEGYKISSFHTGPFLTMKCIIFYLNSAKHYEFKKLGQNLVPGAKKCPKCQRQCIAWSRRSPPWSQPTSDMCTVVREGAHKFWSFLGSFFGIMTKLMGSWAHSFNSWALLLGRHWTHGLICPKNCKNFKSWALSFLSIHEQKSNAPIWNIFSTAGALVVVTV